MKKLLAMLSILGLMFAFGCLPTADVVEEETADDTVVEETTEEVEADEEVTEEEEEVEADEEVEEMEEETTEE